MKAPKHSIKAENLKFGPEIIGEFARSRRAQGRLWAEGYTQVELNNAQEKFGLNFPPDLVALYLERRPVRAWDWRSDEGDIRKALEWPFESLLFDVERTACGGPNGETDHVKPQNERRFSEV